MPCIIVVGSSQGGVAALCALVSGLPKDLPAAILLVQHTGPESMLPAILNDVGGLEASHSEDGEMIRGGHIHVAPPGRHMLVVDGHLALSRGPREHWMRPAIDPLFRSAAEVYGSHVIGVVMTGSLTDGTSGLYEIKRHGGIAIVQAPSDAEEPSMPQSALQNVSVDYCIPLSELPGLLARLAEQAERT